MEFDEALLTIPINPNNFPAKLWRLVNSPFSRSIRWDSTGEGLIVEQQQFEAELLSPQKNSITYENVDLFKTTNFTSFIRQLNLYGFRKVVSAGNIDKQNSTSLSDWNGIRHHFHNPNFKQKHPELLVNLKRLTTSNKAKMEAGLEVNCRPPNRYRRLLATCDGDDKDKVEKRGSVSVGHTHPPISHPYHQMSSQPNKEYDRTPVPPRSWTMGHGDAPSPTTFYTDKGIPISVIHRYPGESSNTVQSSPTTVHIQQGTQGFGNPGQKFSNYIPHHTQYRPGFYSPGPGDLDMIGTSHQTPSYSQYSYYQPNCPVSVVYPGNPNQDWQNTESHVSKKSDVNLDTVFQIVDELQASPKISMVKVETPEKQVHILKPQPSPNMRICSLQVSSQFDKPDNSGYAPTAMEARPATQCEPIITVVPESGTVSELLNVEQREESLTQESEKTPVNTAQQVNFL
ncbi:heat shock factor protein 5 [Aplochiton taeniatus]